MRKSSEGLRQHSKRRRAPKASMRAPVARICLAITYATMRGTGGRVRCGWRCFQPWSACILPGKHCMSAPVRPRRAVPRATPGTRPRRRPTLRNSKPGGGVVRAKYGGSSGPTCAASEFVAAPCFSRCERWPATAMKSVPGHSRGGHLANRCPRRHAKCCRASEPAGGTKARLGRCG